MSTYSQIKLTPFQAFIASGSDISNPDAHDSGYQHALAMELDRIGPGGGKVTLDAEGFRDLGEFARSLANAVADESNSSGARSLATLSECCYRQARILESGEARLSGMA